MSTRTEPGSRQKFLIILLLALFGVIVLTSLARRIAEPSLVVSSFGRAQVPAPEPEMSAIGRLMNEAGQHPDDQAVLLKVAEGLLGQGKARAAGEFAQRALAINGENARALHLMGVINHQQGNHQKAAEFLEKSVAQEENPGARYSLGVLYTHFLGDKQKGSENFRKGLANPAISQDLREAINQELARMGN